jgi:Domain of unknown function (DU1801)
MSRPKGRPVSNAKSDRVTAFIDGLTHTRKAEIVLLRDAIMGCGVELTEQIKWNAPSFCSGDDDRVTFRLQPGDRIELIFHRGAKKRTDKFEFTDPTSLIRWLTPDRGLVELEDATATKHHLASIITLIEAWIQATHDSQ